MKCVRAVKDQRQENTYLQFFPAFESTLCYTSFVQTIGRCNPSSPAFTLMGIVRKSLPLERMALLQIDIVIETPGREKCFQ